MTSSRYEAEFAEGQKQHRPLDILRYDPTAPPSLAITLPRLGAPDEPARPGGVVAGAGRGKRR